MQEVHNELNAERCEILLSLNDPPMLTCSSCQASVGGLHEVYEDLCMALVATEKDPRKQLAKIDQMMMVSTTTTPQKHRALAYMRSYYEWHVSRDEEDLDLMGVVTLAARALLDPCPCTHDRLPYFSRDRERDGQPNVLDVSLCCVRMLSTSPRIHQKLLLSGYASC
jgi:hypothetical protein